MRNREKTFSRFLRSILKSKYLCSHPLLFEFLKVDHHNLDKKIGLRNFTKKLQHEEDQINKKSSFFGKEIVSNGLFRVTAPQNIPVDFSEQPFNKKFDEQSFTLLYEKCINGILQEVPKMEV